MDTTMTDRHFYKHRVTGIIAPLNDTFAAVFGDVFERVGEPTEDAKTNSTQDDTTAAPAAEAAANDSTAVNPANTTADAPKEATN